MNILPSSSLQCWRQSSPWEHFGSPSMGWWWAVWGWGAVTARQEPPGAEMCTNLHHSLGCPLLLGRDIKPLHLLGLQIPACKITRGAAPCFSAQN